MCLPKKRIRFRQNKQTLNNLIKFRRELPNKDHYPRFFLQILLFMQQSIKQHLRSPVPSICSCSNLPDVYVRQRFHQAYQDCSIEQKIDYLKLTQSIIQNPPQIQRTINIERTFSIQVRNFIPWTTRQKAKLLGFRFVTQDYQLDLRRYIVRESRSGLSRSYVLESICEVRPQKLRFAFQETPHVDEDIQVFLESAKNGFMHTAQNWAKKMDHLLVKKPSIIKKTKIGDQIILKQNRWSQIFQKASKSQNGQQIIDKKPQINKYKFTEQSSHEDDKQKQKIKEKKTRKVKTQVSQSSPPNILIQINQSPFKKIMQTTSPSTKGQNMKQELMKKRKKNSITLLTYQPMSRNQKNILKYLVPNYNIKQIQELQEFALFSKKNQDQQMTKFYKSVLKKQIKAKVVMKQFPPQLVVLGFLDLVHYKQWNCRIQQAHIHMKLQSQNCFITSIKFRNTPKSFTLMTHLCQYQNEYYIAFKSLENSTQQIDFLTNAVIKISHQKNRTCIFYHFFYQFSPSIAIQFITSIQQLPTYLSTKLGKQSLKQYLKFGRLIDKQVNNQSIVDFDRRSNEYSYGQEQFGNVSQLQKVKNIQNTFISVGSFSQYCD